MPLTNPLDHIGVVTRPHRHYLLRGSMLFLFFAFINSTMISAGALAAPAYQVISSPPSRGETLPQYITTLAQQKLLENNSGTTDYILKPLNTPRTYHLDPDGLRFQCSVISTLASSTPRVKVEAHQDHQIKRCWIIAFRKIPLRNCFVAQQDFPAGHIIQEGDFLPSKLALNPNVRLWDNSKAPVGYELRRPLRTGDPLLQRDLIKRPLFHKGAEVTLRHYTKGLEIAVKVHALQAGYPGSKLQVKSPGGRILTVWAVSADEVTTSRPARKER